MEPVANFKIATSSVDEALDFTCHLIAGELTFNVPENSESIVSPLQILAQYIVFRYVGEFSLAYEELTKLAELSHIGEPKRQQLSAQLDWLANAMQLPHENQFKPSSPRQEENP